MKGQSIEDLMFLWGYSKDKRFTQFESVKIQAENDWLDGKDAIDNPYPFNYPTNYLKHEVWYKIWLECNKNC